MSNRLLTLMTVFSLSGCAAANARGPAAPDASPMKRAYNPASEPWLVKNGDLIQDALQRYATGNDGLPPDPAFFPPNLATFLPAVFLPPSPLFPDGVVQTRTVSVTAPLRRVNEGKPSAIGTLLGTGRLPTGDDDFDMRTFGAFMYDADTVSKHYVLYGVGKVGNEAVVGYVAVGP